MNVTLEKMEWLREGSTVYTLMHHGWLRGQEQFRNHVWFSVYTDEDGGVSRDDAAAFIFKAVSAHDKLVEALRRAASSAGFQYMTHETRDSIEAALAAAGEPT